MALRSLGEKGPGSHRGGRAGPLAASSRCVGSRAARQRLLGFDDRLVALNHFGGEGEWLDIELCTDPAMLKLCTAAFEAVWERATPHADYQPA
jgi:hypothetical protein